jgi:hypothetical protein
VASEKICVRDSGFPDSQIPGKVNNHIIIQTSLKQPSQEKEICASVESFDNVDCEAETIEAKKS